MGVSQININISPEAAGFIKKKGGKLIIFQGTLSGCCGGSLPSPMFEVGSPRRPLDSYQSLNESGITVYSDNELIESKGTAQISLERTLWWQSLSFNYQDE